MLYSDELIEEIRTKNDIVDVISGYVKLQKKGSTYFGLCPFHNERTPSFSVTPEKEMYYCFGCGAGGNVFTFLMEYENFTFPEALKMLAERVNIPLPKEGEDSREAKKQADFKTRLLQIQKEAGLYFYYQLRSERGRQAWNYLTGRKLTEDTIKRFGLGYANKTGDDLYRYLRQKGYEDKLLKETGLVTIEEKGAHDKFWNRVMFPIMDIHGHVIGFGGRVMGEGEPKYLNSPETKLFDKSRNLYGMNFARTSKRSNFIICEGYMDVIALHQAGFQNAVASLGTAFTLQQALLMKRYTKEVLLTYDSDGAGQKAALRAIPILKEAGLTAKIVNLKPYKDPDEFIKNMGAEEFQKRLENASNSFLYEISVKELNYHMADPEQKTQFFHEIAKMLLEFTEEIERNNYIEAVCKKYQIAYENLRSLVNKYGYQMINQPKSAGGRIKEAAANKNKEKEDGIKKSQRLLLTWMAEDITLFEKLNGVISPRDFTEDFYHTVAEILFEQYKTDKKAVPARIISHFNTEEEQREAAKLFNTSLREEMTKKEKEKALNEIVKKVKVNWCEYAGKNVTELSDLMEIAQIKRSLQDLHISLD